MDSIMQNMLRQLHGSAGTAKVDTFLLQGWFLELVLDPSAYFEHDATGHQA